LTVRSEIGPCLATGVRQPIVQRVSGIPLDADTRVKEQTAVGGRCRYLGRDGLRAVPFWISVDAWERLRAYMRLEFRNRLAVRRDWTPNFDFYVALEVPEHESVVALEGWVGQQPVYSNTFPGAAGAKKSGIRLAEDRNVA
jgi:hypothetical protein